MSKSFYYVTGEMVMVGDIIQSAGCPGFIKEIIQPGSDSAITFDCAEGGVLLVECFGGEQGLKLMRLPDGEFWEDLEFISRDRLSENK